ncbi:MAG: hypothetical protein Q4B63_08030 [Clostridium perfringens]|nr:hypothetical protein [Clostridium perfringens]
MTMIEAFTILNNDCIWNYKDNKNTFFKLYGDKSIGILIYLDINTNRVGESVFTIEDIIYSFRLVPRNGAGKSVEVVRNVLIEFEKLNIISNCNNEIRKIKRGDLVKCKLEIPIKKEEGKNTEFFMIKHTNYVKIMSADTELSNLRLLNIYCYILSRIRRRKEEEHNPRYQMGGKAEYTHPTYEQITADLGISESTFNTYIKYLSELELVFYGNIGVISKNKVIRTAGNVYTVDITQLEYALKESLNYYVELEGWKIIRYDSRKLSKTIKGLKGKIASERNKGKDTEKLEMKLMLALEELERHTGNQVKEVKANVIKRINCLLEKLNEGDDEKLTMSDFFWKDNHSVWNLTLEELNEIEEDVKDVLNDQDF